MSINIVDSYSFCGSNVTAISRNLRRDMMFMTHSHQCHQFQPQTLKNELAPASEQTTKTYPRSSLGRLPALNFHKFSMESIAFWKLGYEKNVEDPCAVETKITVFCQQMFVFFLPFGAWGQASYCVGVHCWFDLRNHGICLMGFIRSQPTYRIQLITKIQLYLGSMAPDPP